MADLVNYGNADRDIEQALITLKKGAQLLKYGRKGKPKFYPFRLSNDGLSLIWISSAGEKNLKLSSVSRIIPGQRTAVFQRYLRPEKDYLSFSLIYNNGKRSLDLICKDKVEAEVWISGLKKLISSGQGGRSKIDGWSDGGLILDDSRDLTSSNPSVSSASAACASQDTSSPDVSVSLPDTSPKSFWSDKTLNSKRSHAPVHPTNMQVKGSGSDAFRISVSSGTSSHGSAPDDYDAVGDVYIWGEIICDNVKIGADKTVNYFSPRAGVLLPRPLESNVVLNVHRIACGVKHASLVTRQGDVFTWGEESGGRLGHGVWKNVVQPRLVEALTSTTIDFVACGEFHSCAVTMAGELYTWGDGTHNVGLLGHGTNVSHWIPKRIAGPLEGLQVAFVACGPWHTALITSTWQLFTFGDGTFGVLGHGDRENVLYPREVESLSGLRTVSVACGVWHTAAVVEVITTQSNANVSSGKLFSWGDGDKNRLGHGDKEARLKPTCVPALIDYNFHKIACGHSLTVGLTTSGRVFTMGGTVYGQLGNPQSDGKMPCLVGHKIAGETVEEIACGAYHVAVLTSKNEVYTWGKGANGRLGHGDLEDRKTPTLVEALKDRHVKYIACGSNYSAAICLHKWVSGAEQAQCSTCRQSFGFTRKRHNCYNCGLVHCHSCSSRKALRAALAPNPGKPYRVCDSCYAKLNKVAEASNNNGRNVLPRLSGENKDRLEKSELRLSKSVIPSNMDLIKQLDNKAAKQGKKADTFSLVRNSQASSLLQLKDVVFSTAAELRRTVPRPVVAPSGASSRNVSPISRRPNPPRSATPNPTTSGLSFSKSVADSLRKTNELLNQEVKKLRSQVESLKQRCELQESELQRSTKKTQEAMALAAEESGKCKAAKDVIKSLMAQLKDVAEKLPPEVYDSENIRPTYLPNGLKSNGIHYPDSNGEQRSSAESISGYSLASIGLESSLLNRTTGNFPGVYGTNLRQIHGLMTSNGTSNYSDVKLPNGGDVIQTSSTTTMSDIVDGRDSGNSHEDESGLRSRNAALATNSSQVEAEWIEQYEPGVYITLVARRDGTRDLKRVRFSRRRFGEHQAETWWSENRDKVYEKYNVRSMEKSSSQTAHRTEAASSPVSQT